MSIEDRIKHLAEYDFGIQGFLRAIRAEGIATREVSLAITKLEEASHWVRAAIQKEQADSEIKGKLSQNNSSVMADSAVIKALNEQSELAIKEEQQKWRPISKEEDEATK